MSETRFTKGPWSLTADYKSKVFAENGSMTICDIRGWGYLTGVGGLHLPSDAAIEIQNANADLIAAAPELYGTLEKTLVGLEGWVREQERNHPESVDGWYLIEQVKAALAKARGEI